MVILFDVRTYWRFLVVLRGFLPLIIAWWRDRRRYFVVGGRRRVDSETRTNRAEVLLETLLTLGPTFVKLGQLLSTRPDVLPPEYVDVLSTLQDDVPPAPWHDTKPVLESELGPVEEVFDEFDTEPISGASLGQVYTAVYGGEPVAVKIRRPGIEPLVEADLRVIRWSLPVIKRLTDQNRAFSLENLADEFAKTIREEMDYERERAMLAEIRSNLAETDGVRVPESIPSICSARVLTMQYVGGIKITDVDALDEAGHDRSALAETLQRTYLQMIIDDGVFHADPHPGNLAVDEDGDIVFYDFGMSGRVEPRVQEQIVDFYIAVADQDTGAILDALIEMGTLSPDADREVMGEVMELAIADARGEDIEQYRVNQIIEQVETTMYEFPLRLPRNLALVLRVATVVEGVCVTLDPEYDFIDTATTYLTEQGYREETARQLLASNVEQLGATADALVTVPPKLDRTLDKANRGSLSVQIELDEEEAVFDRLGRRLAYAILVAVGILSASIIYAFGAEWRLSLVVLALTTPVAVALVQSLRRKRTLRTGPQFTRQNLKNRRGGDR